MITEEQLAKERVVIPFTSTKRLMRDDVLYVVEKDIPHPIYGYSKYHKEYSIIDLRGYRKGYEPRLDIRGIYTPNPTDTFRLQDGHLPPYQPTTTGDKLLAEMRRLGVHKAFRIDKPSPMATGGNPLVMMTEPWQMTRGEYRVAKEKLEDAHYEKVKVWLAEFKGDPNARYSQAELEKERPDLAEEYKTLRVDHHELIKRAIEEGKSVPPEVLRDYPELEGGNPARVRFDRADIDSAIAAAKRLQSEKDLYIFATHLGYTIDHRSPPGMQSYIIVRPDGTTETVEPLRGNPIPEELDLARTLAIIDSRPKGRIIESKLREEFGDAVIDALRQGRYVVSGSAGYNPPLLVSLKGRELIRGNPEGVGLSGLGRMEEGLAIASLSAKISNLIEKGFNVSAVKQNYVDDLIKVGANERWAKAIVDRTISDIRATPFARTLEEVPAVPEVTTELDRATVDLYIERHGREAYERGEIGETLERIDQKAEEYDPAFLAKHPEIKGENITVYHDPLRGEDLAVINTQTGEVIEVLSAELSERLAKPPVEPPVEEVPAVPEVSSEVLEALRLAHTERPRAVGAQLDYDKALSEAIRKVSEKGEYARYLELLHTEEGYRLTEAKPPVVKTEEWKLREAIADTAYGLAHGVKEEDLRKHLTRNPRAKYWFEPEDVDYILERAKLPKIIREAGEYFRRPPGRPPEELMPKGKTIEEVPAILELEDVGREWDKLTRRQRQPIVERANLPSSFAIRDWAELPLSKKDAIRMNFPTGGNPGEELITKEEAIGLLERLSMTPGEAARSLVADEAERMEIMQTVQQRVKREQNKWAPMDPREGPPLPRIFAGLRWPWKK